MRQVGFHYTDVSRWTVKKHKIITYLLRIRACLSQIVRIEQDYKHVSRMDGWIQRHCGTELTLRVRYIRMYDTKSSFAKCVIIFDDCLEFHMRASSRITLREGLGVVLTAGTIDICRVCEFRDSRNGIAGIPFFCHMMLRQRVIWYRPLEEK